MIELLVVVAIIALLISILLPSLQQAREQAKATTCASNLRQMGLAMQQYVEDEGFYPGEHSNRPNTLTSRAIIQWITWAPRIRLYASMQEKLWWCPSADNKSYWKPVMNVPFVPSYVQGYGYQLGEKPLRADSSLFCYGYNSWGVNEFIVDDGHLVMLGLGAHVDDANWPEAWNVRPDDIKKPAEMIAIGDAQTDGVYDSALDPETDPSSERGDPYFESPSARHKGGAEILYCDGHVQWGQQRELIRPVSWMRRQWNNDNMPHWKWWPPGGHQDPYPEWDYP